jgi:hypothetical protein
MRECVPCPSFSIFEKDGNMTRAQPLPRPTFYISSVFARHPSLSEFVDKLEADGTFLLRDLERFSKSELFERYGTSRNNQRIISRVLHHYDVELDNR